MYTYTIYNIFMVVEPGPGYQCLGANSGPMPISAHAVAQGTRIFSKSFVCFWLVVHAEEEEEQPFHIELHADFDST